MSERLFGIQYQDGKYEKFTGKTIAEAFSKNGRKTTTGEIDFSFMDFCFTIPAPVDSDCVKEYQVFVMRDKKSNWEPVDLISTSFTAMEDLMKLKVRMEGFFSGIVVELSNSEKILSWIWTR